MGELQISKEEPFHQEDYRKIENRFHPMVDVLIGNKGTKVPALVDTGCTAGIWILKDQIKDLDIGEKISDEVSRYMVADGDIIGGEEYVSWVQINGEKQVVIVTVINPQNKIGHEEDGNMTPLLGRNFLDHYNVTFKGKIHKLELSR